MLDLARRRGVHERLVVADMRDCGLPSAAYDLVICSLLDEHLPEVAPLYAEVGRLLAPDRASFVLVGMHPFFLRAWACRRISTGPAASTSPSRPTSISPAST
jgi:SAM-dependent methyltransferase